MACEVFNGELGFVQPHLFDKNWKWEGFRLKRFRVSFARKEHLAVGYGRDLGQIGRASCRERVESAVGGGWLKKKRKGREVQRTGEAEYRRGDREVRGGWCG